MAEQIEYKWTVDDSDVVAAAEKFVRLIDTAIAESKDFEDAFQKALDTGSDDIKKLAKDVQDFTKRQQESAAATAKQDEGFKRLKSSIGTAIRDVKVFGVSIGGITDKLKGTQAGLKDFAGGLKAMAQGAGVARLAVVGLASVAIAALLLILAPVILALTKFQENMDKIRILTAQAGTAIDVFTERLANAGQIILNFFQGEVSLSEATDQLKNSFNGLNEEMTQALALTKELETAQIRLEKETAIVATRYALQRSEIERLKLVAEDTTKSLREREAAAREAFSIENQLVTEQNRILRESATNQLRTLGNTAAEAQENLDKIISLVKEAGQGLSDSDIFDLVRDNLGITASSNKEAEAFLGIIKQIGEGQEQSLTRQIELNNKINSIRQEAARRAEEERKRVQALRDAYQKLVDELSSRVVDANISQLAGVDKLIAEKELAIQEVNKFVAEVKAAAAAAGADLPASFQQDIQKLIAAVEFEFRAAVDKQIGRDGTGGPLSALVFDPLRNIDRDLELIGSDAVEAYARGFAKKEPLLQRINIALFEAFKINDQDRQLIGQAIGQTFSSFTTGLDFAAQAQITQQDNILAAIEERINRTQELLDIELERQRNGYANNVAALQTSLEEENATREEAQKKRLELERKAARQRLIANQAEQISNYVLSVTRLTATESLKGLPGVFTAIAGVALLFSLIQQARAQSKQFEVPQFREGTPWVDGPGTHTSDSVPAMLSRGERIMPAALNMAVGGRKTTNEELVELFKLGKAWKQDSTAAPNYSYDLGPLIAAMQTRQRDVKRMEAGINYGAMREAYEKAANNSASRMIEYWKSRPVEKVGPGGDKMIEWFDGETVRRQIVKK